MLLIPLVSADKVTPVSSRLSQTSHGRELEDLAAEVPRAVNDRKSAFSPPTSPPSSPLSSTALTTLAMSDSEGPTNGPDRSSNLSASVILRSESCCSLPQSADDAVSDDVTGVRHPSSDEPADAENLVKFMVKIYLHKQ
jgi:hypothetical protein